MKMVKSLVVAAAAFGSLILPSGLRADTAPQYRIAEWIESTGKQYFDTEFCPDGTAAKAELKYKLTNTPSGENWALSNWGGGIAWRTGAKAGDNFTAAILDNFTLAKSSTGGTGTLSSYLFAQHKTGGTGVEHIRPSVRLWYCQMWNNAGELARDFVPAQRLSDGAMGLLDRARGIFVEAMGTDTDKFLSGALGFDIVVLIAAAESATAYSFAAPADYTDEEGRVRSAVSWAFTAADGTVISGGGSTAEFTTDKAGVLVWAMYADGDAVGFADEYREVEYIESNGKQFLDTGYVPNEKTVCEVKCQQITSKGENVAIGIWGEISWRGRTDQNSSSGFTRSTVDGWYLLKSSAGSASGAKVSAMLFAQNGKGLPASNNTNIRMASCKFTEDGVPVMDLAPAVRVSDGRAGLYDRVSGKFIEDNLGTTPFAVGSETGVCWVNVQRLGAGQAVDLSRPEVDTSLDGMRKYVASGWSFVDVDGTETQGEGATCQFNFTKPGRLTWLRSQSSVKVVVTSGEHGTVTPAEQWCEIGEEAKFTFVVDPGYGFSGFTGDLVTARRSFVGEKPLHLTANFEAGQLVEYAALESIDTNGRYFDTGYVPNGNNAFVSLEHKYLAFSTSTREENWAFGLYGGSPWRIGLAADGKSYQHEGAGILHVHEMCGDHEIVYGTNCTSSASISCYLCAQHLSSGKQGSAKFRLYGCKLGDADGLCRDYVPATRTSDGVMGLYDRVTGTFDEGLGTGEITGAARKYLVFTRISGFEPGAVISVPAPDDYVDENGHTWEAVSWRLLDVTGEIAAGTGKAAEITYPEGACTVEWKMYSEDDLHGTAERYHAVEYVEATGSQAIDTGYIPKPNTTCEIKCYQVTDANECIALGIWTSGAYWRGRTSQNNADGFRRVSAGDGWYLLTAAAGPAAAKCPVAFYGQNQGTSIKYGSCIRIAYCKFWEDGELVADFVPAVRESDEIVGFFERVSGVFHAAVKSTAAATNLTAGPEPTVQDKWVRISGAKVGGTLSFVGPQSGINDDETTRWSSGEWTLTGDDGEVVASGLGQTASFAYQKPGWLTWKIKYEHPVTLAEGVHCTVTPPAGWDGWGAEDEPLKFTVTPEAGYEFYKLADGDDESFVPSIAPQRPFTALTAYCRTRRTVAASTSVELQAAIDAASPGDILEVSGAGCELDATLNVTNEVKLVASPSTLFYKKQGVKTMAIKINQRNAVVSGVTLTNMYDQASDSTKGVGIYVVNGTLKDSRIIGLQSSHYYLALENGLIRNCEICNCTGSYYNDPPGSVLVAGGVCDGLKVHHNTSDYCPGVAIKGGELRNAAIYANVMNKEQSTRNCAGIYATGGKVWNCTVYGNVVKGENLKPSGLAVDGTVTVRNCIFWRNYAEGATGGSVSIGAGKDFSHNVNDIELANYPDTITDDPCLMNPDGGNFRLLHGSPCVDKGENADWMEGSTDLRGRARVLNKTVDIGCRESIPDGLMIYFR